MKRNFFDIIDKKSRTYGGDTFEINLLKFYLHIVHIRIPWKHFVLFLLSFSTSIPNQIYSHRLRLQKKNQIQ